MTVQPNEEMIILNWGEYLTKVTVPNWYCINPSGTELRRISVKRQTIELEYTKVADGNGNPLLVSGVVTYKVEDSAKALLNVEDVYSFVRNQALAVLKRVAAQYPYESYDNSQPSLKSEADHISAHMVEMLQSRIDASGVRVLNYELTDLSYAPEIAQAMLARQQAEALISARKVIVDGAVAITQGAVNQMTMRGIEMTNHEKAVLATNLLTVICGDRDATVTLPLNSAEQGHTGHRK